MLSTRANDAPFSAAGKDNDESSAPAAVNVGVGFQLADLFCDHDDDFVDPGLFENLSQVLVVVDTDDAQAVF